MKQSRRPWQTNGDIYRLHEAVMSGFKDYGDRPRVLFRTEPEWNKNGIHILVQSPVNPDWSGLNESDKGLINIQVKPFNPVLTAGHMLRFRLRANPTVKRGGKRYGLIRDEALEEWLTKWESRMGVTFSSISVIDEGYLNGRKKNNEIRIKSARFEGRFKIIQPDILVNRISEGNGCSKSALVKNHLKNEAWTSCGALKAFGSKRSMR